MRTGKIAALLMALMGLASIASAATMGDFFRLSEERQETAKQIAANANLYRDAFCSGGYPSGNYMAQRHLTNAAAYLQMPVRERATALVLLPSYKVDCGAIPTYTDRLLWATEELK